jgi:DNA-binding transcriptional regulator PaaX
MHKRNNQRKVLRNLSRLEPYQPWISHSSMGLIRWFIESAGEDNQLTEEQVRQSIHNLKKKKYIKKVHLRDGGVRIEFTNKGKEYLRKHELEDLSIQNPKHWDGQWHFVIFDVPEKYRYARGVLRDTLKRLGFFRMQQSVWVYPYACEEEVDFLVEFLHLRTSVLQFVGRIKHDEVLREYFRRKGIKL